MLSVEQAKIISKRFMLALKLKVNKEEQNKIENSVINCLIQGIPLSKRNLTFCAGEHSVSNSTWFRVVKNLKTIGDAQPDIWHVTEADIVENSLVSKLASVFQEIIAESTAQHQSLIDGLIRSHQDQLAILKETLNIETEIKLPCLRQAKEEG
jgi:hypothetical protein